MLKSKPKNGKQTLLHVAYAQPVVFSSITQACRLDKSKTSEIMTIPRFLQAERLGLSDKAMFQSFAEQQRTHQVIDLIVCRRVEGKL